MKDTVNERSLYVVPDMASISQVSDFLDGCVEEYGIPMRTGYSLKVVADEIYSNIVHYSGAKTAQVLFRNDEDAVTLVFCDDGVAYDPTETEEPDITAGVEERKIGGLGLFMVKKMAESVLYAYTDQRNQLTVTLSKKAKKKPVLEDF